jgi:N-acetylmuramoyl-L-alanine amidase
MVKRLIISGLTILHLTFVIGHLSFASPVELTAVEMKKDRGYDYLDVYTTGYAEAKGLLLEDTLYVDFPGCRLAKGLKFKTKKSRRIAGVSFSQKDARTARIVVTLKRTIDYDIVNVFGRDKSVIEIGDRLDNIFARQIAAEKAYFRRKAAPLKPVELKPTAVAALRGRTIILDPGHGGDDPGARNGRGAPEKELTLDTARRTAELLRAAGARVLLTRDEDRRSNLYDIVDFANRSGADIFISIHYNSTYTGRISGSESYYYDPSSRRFAAVMHEAIVRGLDRKDRGLHRVSFYTVKNTRMPSVLVEPAYLSNNDERDLIDSAAFRAKVAAALAKGVKDYF